MFCWSQRQNESGHSINLTRANKIQRILVEFVFNDYKRKCCNVTVLEVLLFYLGVKCYNKMHKSTTWETTNHIVPWKYVVKVTASVCVCHRCCKLIVPGKQAVWKERIVIYLLRKKGLFWNEVRHAYAKYRLMFHGSLPPLAYSACRVSNFRGNLSAALAVHLTQQPIRALRKIKGGGDGRGSIWGSFLPQYFTFVIFCVEMHGRETHCFY